MTVSHAKSSSASSCLRGGPSSLVYKKRHGLIAQDRVPDPSRLQVSYEPGSGSSCAKFQICPLSAVVGERTRWWASDLASRPRHRRSVWLLVQYWAKVAMSSSAARRWPRRFAFWRRSWHSAVGSSVDPSPRTTALELCGHAAAAERGRLHWKSKRPPRPSSSFHNTGVALNRDVTSPWLRLTP